MRGESRADCKIESEYRELIFHVSNKNFMTFAYGLSSDQLFQFVGGLSVDIMYLISKFFHMLNRYNITMDRMNGSGQWAS